MKAPFTLLEVALEKTVAVFALIAVSMLAYPEVSLAASVTTGEIKKPIVFEINSNKTTNINVQAAGLTYAQLQLTSPDYHLEILLKQYLEKRGSPLAECTSILLTEAPKNWQKILSLANAESGMGKRYPKATANMWGVGGSKLWDFGDTPCDGVRGMNDFLNNYPRRATVKYTDWTIEKMNCVYKQPCGAHWVRNNNVILAQLKGLESQANTLAQEHTKTALAKTIELN